MFTLSTHLLVKVGCVLHSSLCGPSDGTRRASRPDYPRNREFRRTCITECLCNGSSARDERVGIVPAKDGDKCIAQGER